jgi:RNA polymerase sigma-70 factor (ECF subfamily)
MKDQNQYLEALVREHWSEVHALLTVITRNVAQAEDLSQEVFLLAWRKNIQPGPGLRSWLRKVAKYLAMNAMRKKRPLSLDPADLQRIVESESDRDDEPFPDKLTALKACMAGLSTSDGDLLEAKYEDGKSLATIAETTKQTVGYLKQRLFRLRRRLADCVNERMITVGSEDV